MFRIPTSGLISILLVLFSVSAAFAGNRYSICSGGNWSSTSCWSATPGGPMCACTPSPGSDDIFIQTNMNLNVSLTGGNAIGESLTIASGVSLNGTSNDLTIKTGATLTVYGDMDVRNIDIQNNSNILIETGAVLEVWGGFINSNNSDQVILNGTLILHGACYNGNGGNISGTGTVIYSNAGCTGGGTWAVANSGTLPIELLAFSAQLGNGSGAMISWVTATETNNDYFTIERTKDGVSYEVVGIEDGAGTSISAKEYLMIDPSPYQGISYYRLKQTDFNGQFKYSELVTLERENDDLEITIYPNPGSAGDMVMDVVGEEKTVTVVIYDMYGRKCYSHSVKIEEGGSKLTIDPEQKLAPGVYTVTAMGSSSQFSQKVIVK